MTENDVDIAAITGRQAIKGKWDYIKLHRNVYDYNILARGDVLPSGGNKR